MRFRAGFGVMTPTSTPGAYFEFPCSDTVESVAHGSRETPFRGVVTDADDPVALYVHGSGGAHRLWAHQYGPDRPVEGAAALDLAGHGEAGDVDVNVDAEAERVRDGEGEVIDAYVDDVAAVADAIDADVLVGNSLGGVVVLRALLDNRVDPEAIVLAGTGAKLAVAEDLRTLLAEDFEQAIEVLHGDDVLFHDVDDELRRRSVATTRAVGQRVTRRDFLVCHRFDVRDRLDEIDVPALAVVGEYDSLTPVEYHEHLTQEIPVGKLAVVDDAAHLAMLERPAAFDEVVAEFCDAVLSDGSTSPSSRSI